jgi:hypothetical protein
MFSKIALVGVLGFIAMVTSATAYMGIATKGSCCQKSAMIAAPSSCGAGQVSCCLKGTGDVASAKSSGECADCVCADCLPEDNCCVNRTCCEDGNCCEGSECSGSSAKLVSKTDEACTGDCCAQK